jgi:hypothetical protein
MVWLRVSKIGNIHHFKVDDRPPYGFFGSGIFCVWGGGQLPTLRAFMVLCDFYTMGILHFLFVWEVCNCTPYGLDFF